jgi:hypothetical protein
VDNISLPVACNLTERELQERRRDVLHKVRGAVEEVSEVEFFNLFNRPNVLSLNPLYGPAQNTSV